jgi:DNA-binding SARP family transcriptional activator
MDLRIRTLGELRVFRGEKELARISEQPTRAALLVYLAVERAASRDMVQRVLWGHLPQDRARHALNQALYLLRRDLGDDWIVSEGERLRVSDRVLVDAVSFQAAVEQARMDEAVKTYRGEFLGGWHLRGTPEFEQWVDRVRLRFSRLHREARRARLDDLGEQERLEEALTVAREWVRLDPLEDEAHHRLIELLGWAGKREEALERYDAYRRLLRPEALQPLDETVELVERIRAGVTGPDGGRESPVLPGRAEPPRRRFVWRYAAVALLAVPTGLLLRGARSDGPSPPTADPNRVLVFPLENRTGDPALEYTGSLAADWIAQGLASVEFLNAVPARELLPGAASSRDGEPDLEVSSPARRAAVETGSGTLVTGAYYRAGDGLEFHLRILEAPRWEVVETVGPVRTSSPDPVEAVEVLRQRVLVFLARARDESLDGVFDASEVPPSYPAYLAFLEGFGKFIRGDDRGAAVDLLSAHEISPEFTSPLVIAGFALIRGWGDYRAADSVARIVAASRAKLPRYDRLRLDLLQATLRGDHARAYRAVKEAAAIVPGGTAHFASAYKALDLNRPLEALEILSSWDHTRPSAVGWAPFWDVTTQSHHLLSEHREELRWAREGRRMNPDRMEMAWFEIRALAAAGRVTETLEVAGESVSHRWTPLVNPGWILVRAAEELRAHGFEEGALEVLDRFHLWLDCLSPAERATRDLRFLRGQAQYLEGRYGEAREVFEELHAEAPADPDPIRFLGTIAAASGDPQEAEWWSALLLEMGSEYLFGRHTLGRAAIAARLGDREAALTLLQASLSQGMVFGTLLHADPDLSALRGYAPYRAFMHPKG